MFSIIKLKKTIRKLKTKENYKKTIGKPEKTKRKENRRPSCWNLT